jgi:hypothetical protein
VVGILSDRAGNTFVNVLGQGLWSYGGPGGTMRRWDQGRYTSMINARRQGNGNPRGYGNELFFQVVTNPNGPGFCPISWCSFQQQASQICSPDGKELFNFWQPRDSWDFGTCDWNADVPEIFLICHHHSKGETWLSTDGGRSFEIIFDDGSRLQALGVIGPNVLLKALSRKYSRGEFVESEDDDRLVGVHRSTDLGKTWTRVSEIEVTRGKGAIVYHEANDRAYLNTQNGLAVSDDKGASWRLVEDSPFFYQPVWFGREDTHLVGANPEGFYESTDAGETWQKVLDAPEGVTAFAWDPTRDVFYAGEYNGLWYRYER